MSNNRILHYFLYCATAALFSEVAYQLYLIVRKHYSNRKKPEEIADVIWTNELTQTCQSCSSRTSPIKNVTSKEKNDKIKKQNFALPKSPNQCTNIYCATNNIGKLVSYVDNCKYSIDLAMYTFTSYDLHQAFQRAIKRGISLRIISDKEMVYSSGSQIINLTKADVAVRCPNSSALMHHKFCILDGDQRVNEVLSKAYSVKKQQNVQGIVLTGSLNWTMQGFNVNWENIVISSNKIVVKKFEQEFQRMWLAFDKKDDKNVAP